MFYNDGYPASFFFFRQILEMSWHSQGFPFILQKINCQNSQSSYYTLLFSHFLYLILFSGPTCQSSSFPRLNTWMDTFRIRLPFSLCVFMCLSVAFAEEREFSTNAKQEHIHIQYCDVIVTYERSWQQKQDPHKLWVIQCLVALV